jgi:hypothetical protein
MYLIYPKIGKDAFSIDIEDRSSAQQKTLTRDIPAKCIEVSL